MIFALVMLGALAILVGVTLLLEAWAILSPPRMSDGKAVYLLKRLSPGDLGMEFEEVRFKIRDSRTNRPLNIASWWIPHPAGGEKTVVLIHGYADAKVGSIAWAQTWRELGYHILAIDLRAHGESGGKFTTAGFFERHDLDQVLNQLRAEKPNQTRQIALFGASLGAVVALATAGIRDDIAAVVLDSPIRHFRDGAKAQVNLLGLPLPGMFDATIRIAKWLSRADFDEIQPIALIGSVKCPVMVIQSGDDPYVSTDQATQIEAAVKGRADGCYWFLKDVPHLLALQADHGEYRQRVAEFLAQNNLI